MNPLLSTATTYLRELVKTLNSPQVRSQLQAVLQSAEMKTLIGTVRDSARGMSPTPAAQPAPVETVEQPSPDSAPAAATTGRARRRARAKQEPHVS